MTRSASPDPSKIDDSKSSPRYLRQLFLTSPHPPHLSIRDQLLSCYHSDTEKKNEDGFLNYVHTHTKQILQQLIKDDQFKHLAQLCYEMTQLEADNPERIKLKSILHNDAANQLFLQHMAQGGENPAFNLQLKMYLQKDRVPIDILAGHYFFMSTCTAFVFLFKLKYIEVYLIEGKFERIKRSLPYIKDGYELYQHTLTDEQKKKIKTLLALLKKDLNKLNEEERRKLGSLLCSLHDALKTDCITSLEKGSALKDLSCLSARFCLLQSEISHAYRTIKDPNTRLTALEELLEQQKAVTNQAVRHHAGPAHVMQAQWHYSMSTYLREKNKALKSTYGSLFDQSNVDNIDQQYEHLKKALAAIDYAITHRKYTENIEKNGFFNDIEQSFLFDDARPTMQVVREYITKGLDTIRPENKSMIVARLEL